MKFFINEKIIEETKDCTMNFSCLTGEKTDLCLITSCFDCDVHFIHCSNKEPCAYRKKISERSYCDCPVRKEIYDTHKI